jgi:hypothetical protein
VKNCYCDHRNSFNIVTCGPEQEKNGLALTESIKMQCMALLTELAGFASSSLSNSNNRFYRHNRQSGKRFSQIVVIVLCLCRTTIITACRARHLSREGENTLKLITIFNILTILQSLLSVPIRNPSKHFPKEVF